MQNSKKNEYDGFLVEVENHLSRVDPGSKEYHAAYSAVVREKTNFGPQFIQLEAKYTHLPVHLKTAAVKILLRLGLDHYRTFLSGLSLGLPIKI